MSFGCSLDTYVYSKHGPFRNKGSDHIQLSNVLMLDHQYVEALELKYLNLEKWYNVSIALKFKVFYLLRQVSYTTKTLIG